MAVNSLFLEFAFERCTRPIDLGISDDPRCLAVGFREIIGRDAAGQVACRIDFASPQPAGVELACGVDAGEPGWGGAWSDGARVCLLVTPARPVRRLEIRHTLPRRMNRAAIAQVVCNGVAAGRIAFEGGQTGIDLPAEAARFDRNVSLAPDAKPDVSVLILNLNRPDLARKAVLSVLAGVRGCTFEIILVDNGSTPQRFRELAAMDLPVRLVRLERGRCFGEGNNLAATLARGDHLLLMNNDVFVTHGAVDALRDALQTNPGVGAVGPVFRFPDGKMQEAGGVVTLDGEASQRGFRDPMFRLETLPELDEVGYLSAACLMLRRADFLALGGFDPAFEPAYYEDTDLCQRLRSLGKSILLATRAQVFHVMNATTRDPASGIAIDAVGRRHRLRFVSRWGDPQSARNPAMRAPIAPPVAQVPDYPDGSRTFAVRADVQSEPALALGQALAQIGPTKLLGDVSELTARHLLARFQLPPLAMSVPQADTSAGESLMFVSTREALPADAPGAARSILHCPYPLVDAAWSRSEIARRSANLARFERVIVDSACARRALLEAWRRLGVPPRAIEVVHPPADLAGYKPSAKESLIVCHGTFSARHVLHEAMLDAWARFRNSAEHKSWQLVLCGDLEGLASAGVFEELTDRALPLGARVLLDPPADALRDLLGRARIYVSAESLGFRAPDAEWMSSLAATSLVRALSAGCVAVVHSVGVPAEICDQLSCGVRFAAREELPGALEKAMSASPPAAIDPQLKSFSWPAYVDRVRRVAAGEAPVALGIEPPTPAAIAPSRRALVIVGCHRSGTSAMARTLGLAGAALPARLMEPAPDNPTGFWEPREISGLNDRLLGSIGCAWHDVAAAGRAQRRDLLDTIFLPQARELVHEEYADASLIALKDPRISLLAPFWDNALLGEGFGACFVIMVRSPFEVAASLHARNGIALDKGLLLWGTYLLAAERDTRDRPRVFVAFEDLLRDPAGTLNRVGSTLDVALGVAAMEEIARYLDAGLNHFTDSGWAADARYRPIQALYDAALGACRSPAFDDAAWSRGAAGFEDLLRWVDAAV